ncbi:unnamed protein product [Paramecium pentaurelia]|uniref:Kinesin motor domain-containing protein n=1 Tax=Paramecium pentaurelia TaxID=43138 RepID=A0A8S1XPD1_9CILI|nr:unnamed protein product [Paramecium pentaurelia]
MSDNILVYLKVKPDYEEEGGLTIQENTVKVISQSSFEEKTYQFNAIFQENHELQQHCIPIIDQAIRNQQNACIITYGQTQSGKSHALGFSLHNEGLLHTFLQYLFEQMQIQQVSISMLQLYMQSAIDLLSQDKTLKELRIRNKQNETYVENLTEVLAQNYQESLLICQEGIQKTQFSKLHTILTLKVMKSKIQFVEILGNNSINAKSPQSSNCITALLKVFSALLKQQQGTQQQVFIPFRDSSLTMLLKNQLTPPSKIIVIGTILPKNTIETSQTIKALSSCIKVYPPQDNINNTTYHNNASKARSVTPTITKQKRQDIIVNNGQQQQQQQQSNQLQYKELSEYLLKLLTKINSHACKLINQECLQHIDINQNLDKIISQVQQVSHQLLQIINGKITSQINQAKTDGWQKALKFLYHTYEEEIQREDKLLKEKLLYIINEEEQYDLDSLRKILFPPKQEYTNSLFKTLTTLRKYTNTIQIPLSRENYRNQLTNDIMQKELGVMSNQNYESSGKQELTSFQSYTENLMSKFKWQSAQKQDYYGYQP